MTKDSASRANAECERDQRSKHTGRLRIVVAGAWQWPWYEEACAAAFADMGHDVIPFAWGGVFGQAVPGCSEPERRSRLVTTQHRVMLGPAISKVNRDLRDLVAGSQPDVLLLYRAPLVLPKTLRKIRRDAPRTIIAQYCNDDPFSPRANPLRWRHLRRSIPQCDVHFVYREANLADFVAAGARRVHLLRSYYVPSLHFPIAGSQVDASWQTQLLFAGHYEDDQRVACLATLLRDGIDVRLYGGGWDRARRSQVSMLGSLLPTQPVTGEQYRQAACGAKVALCFLSSLNRDTYTRRNFELPAMGAFVLSQYTDDLSRLFVEGAEIEFFRNRDQLLSKARHYLRHHDEREVVARAGRARVERDGHDVCSRMAEMLAVLRDVSR